MSPKKTKHACGAWMGVNCRFCSACGESNPDFDADLAGLLQRGHRSGWKKPVESEAPELDAAAPSGLLNQLDDLMRELRRRKEAPSTEGAAAAPPQGPDTAPSAAAAAVPVAATPAAAPAAPVAALQEEEVLDEREYDLNNVDDCVSWMVACWKDSFADTVEPVCRFFIESHLRPMVCKGKPLSFWLVTKVIQAKLLQKRDTRKAFLDCWRADRAKRFCKGPKQVWKKHQ